MKAISSLAAISAALCWTSSSFAALESKGSVVFVGSGIASSPPEYVTLSINVTSMCYDSSTEASAANAKLANNLLSILQSFKKTDSDQVTATGAMNVRQTETSFIGSESRVICELKWRSTNSLQLRMTSLNDLPDLQDRVFAELGLSSVLDPSLVAQTFAEVGRPQFGIFSSRANELRNQATASAFDDGNSQFKALMARCPLIDPKLVTVTPPEYAFVAKRAGEVLSYSSGPAIPDDMEMRVSLRMEWEFTPSSVCQNMRFHPFRF